MHSIPQRGRRDNGGTPAASVNLGGIPLAEAERVPMVTISVLSEGEYLCNLCGLNIEGLAAYVTNPDESRRDGFRVVALLCVEHIEVEEAPDDPEHVREAAADAHS